MATSASLYDLLSVAVRMLQRARSEVADLPLEPMQPNFDRLARVVDEVRAVRDIILAEHPSFAANPDDQTSARELSTTDRAFATCLVEAESLERDRLIPEAIAVYERFLLGAPSTEQRSVVADQIKRLLYRPEDDPVDLRPSQAVLAHIGALSVAQLEQIDQTLLTLVGPRFKKLALVVVEAIIQLADQVPPISDVFYAQRLIRFVRLGQLEGQGDLSRMRYGMVRKPR